MERFDENCCAEEIKVIKSEGSPSVSTSYNTSKLAVSLLIQVKLFIAIITGQIGSLKTRTTTVRNHFIQLSCTVGMSSHIVSVAMESSIKTGSKKS
jgi:hypothetical protein